MEPGPSSALGPAITADGRAVAMIGVRGGARRAFVRHLDRPQAVALPGNGANGIVFSPDARVVSVSRDGAAMPRDQLPSERYANPRIASDGRRLLVEVGGNVIEALDRARGTRARLTAAARSVLFSTCLGG